MTGRAHQGPKGFHSPVVSGTRPRAIDWTGRTDLEAFKASQHATAMALLHQRRQTSVFSQRPKKLRRGESSISSALSCLSLSISGARAVATVNVEHSLTSIFFSSFGIQRLVFKSSHYYWMINERSLTSFHSCEVVPAVPASKLLLYTDGKLATGAEQQHPH